MTLRNDNTSKTHCKTTLLISIMLKTRRKIDISKRIIQTAPSLFRLFLFAHSQFNRKTNRFGRRDLGYRVKYGNFEK